MVSFYLNSYSPLVVSPQGRLAVERFDIPPFVDGSIRREPDFEHRYPGISCLCRGANFARRLRKGDVVAYVTNKRNFGIGKERRLTAVLHVRHVFDSHREAADWYTRRGLPLPSNCMVPGNRPKPFVQSHGHDPGNDGCDGWDASYRERARQWGTFVVCRRLWWNLDKDAPVVEDRHLLKAFGRLPGLRNPGQMTIGDLHRFAEVMRLPIRIPSER